MVKLFIFYIYHFIVAGHYINVNNCHLSKILCKNGFKKNDKNDG